MKITVITSLALLAFAGNSVLCRWVLGEGLMDAEGFTSVRLLSGAVTLSVLFFCWSNKPASANSWSPKRSQFIGSSMLYLYAWCFSLAYLTLDTGSGALILFGFVQLTLLFSAWFTGKRPGLQEMLGMLLAFMGLLYWLVPAWGTPSLTGFTLMGLAGIAWGIYTLEGRKTQQPLQETTKNFIYCLPLVLLLNLIVFEPSSWTQKGVFLAVISGAVTSGVGYALWYRVLPELSPTLAGVLQLLVPILAAFGGVIFASEVINQKLIIASVMVLGGVFWVLQSGKK